MKILITGGTGFVGKTLITQLQQLGHSLTILTRNPTKNSVVLGDWHTYIYWDALTNEPPKEVYENIDVIINLMGEGVAEKRWSKAQKKKIKDTRIIGTKNLVSGALKHASSLKTFISASAIGYYDHKKKGEKFSDAPPSADFMGKLCEEWEIESKKISTIASVREVRFRIGLVLGNGGALNKLSLPISLGLGGPLGSGKQWMNWIHITDLCHALISAIDTPTFKGPYNAVAPENCTNRHFIKQLGKILKRPTLFFVPSVLLKVALGEMSVIVLEGQRVMSKGLEKTGFKFRFPSLTEALEDAMQIRYIPHLKKKIKCQKFQSAQWLNYEPSTVFDFFSNAHNLEKITPPLLQFKIEKQSTEKIEENTIFDYKLKIHGIPIRWKSLITNWNPIASFEDTQLKGPYKVWHHTHRFIPFNSGTLTEDEIYYAPPYIPIGKAIVNVFLKKDIVKIFNHRKKSIIQLLSIFHVSLKVEKKKAP